MPIASPSVGKMSAAKTLNRNTTEMAWATSWSLALMTGAVAAIAEPPQMDDPTPISVAVRLGTCSAWHRTNAVSSDAVMVDTITGSVDCADLGYLGERQAESEQNHGGRRIFFDVNLIPAAALPLSFQNMPIIMPERMANTAPPTIGTAVPKNQQTAASAALVAMPGARVRIVLMGFFLDWRTDGEVRL